MQLFVFETGRFTQDLQNKYDAHSIDDEYQLQSNEAACIESECWSQTQIIMNSTHQHSAVVR